MAEVTVTIPARRHQRFAVDAFAHVKTTHVEGIEVPVTDIKVVDGGKKALVTVDVPFEIVHRLTGRRGQ